MLKRIKKNKKIDRKSCLLAVIIFGIVLRLVVINQSFWLDEAIGALVVREQNFSQIATQFPKGDNHPPLYYLALEAWSNLFGFSEPGLRSLSVLLGVLTVLYIFLIAKKLVGDKNRFFPLFSTLLLATSPFHIYYSQEARMYAMASFFAVASIYYFLLTLDRKLKRNYSWLLFSLSITALVFTDYVPVFLLPVFWIYAFIKKADGKWWKNFILSQAPLAVFGIVWLPIFILQLERGAWLLQKLPAWRTLAGGATFKQAILVWMKFILGRISFRDKVFYYSLVFISSIPFVFAMIKAWKTKNKNLIPWIWFSLPLVLGFVVSFIFPVFIYFRFLYVIPAFYLIVAWGVNQIKIKKVRILLGALLLFVNMIGWLIYVGEPYQQRERWREAVDFIEKNANKDDVVLFENPEPFAPYRWYAKGEIGAFGATDSISANEKGTKGKVLSIIKNYKGIYYFEYLRDLHDPRGYVEQAITSENFKKGDIFDFIGVGQVTYWFRE